jgi:hypothetical protein
VTGPRTTRPSIVRWLVTALLCAPLLACFSGVKYASDGEICESGDQLFAGEVACAGGLRCVPFDLSLNGGRTGLCAPSCDSQSACAAGLVCAAGACVPPCSSQCYSVCCRFPLEGVNACLPEVACDSARGFRDAGTDAVDLDAEIGQ